MGMSRTATIAQSV